MVVNVYQQVFVNARLDLVGSHVASVCYFEIISRDKYSLSSILDKGCNMGGLLACQNNGLCLSNGFCECKQRFSGTTCSIKLSNLSKIRKL